MYQISRQGISKDRVVKGSVNDKTLDRLTCGICLELFWKPICCSICGTNFCEACMNKWLSSKTVNDQKCPNRCNYKKSKSPPLLFDLLSDVIITCCYAKAGCNEEIPYDQLEKHENNCLFQLKECKWCKTLIIKKELAQHEENTCLFQPNECKWCRKLIIKKDLAQHAENCDSKEMSCQICGLKLTKKQFKNHEEVTCLRSAMKLMIDKYEKQIEALNKEILELKRKLKENKSNSEDYEEKYEGNDTCGNWSSLSCENGHKLRFMGRSKRRINYYYCQNCKGNYTRGSWSCLSCQYHLCLTCIPIIFKKDTCPNDHSLNLCSRTYFCDKCLVNFAALGNYCSSCDFDLCQTCNDNL